MPTILLILLMLFLCEVLDGIEQIAEVRRDIILKNLKNKT